MSTAIEDADLKDRIPLQSLVQTIEKAKTRELLYHYTNLEALVPMLATKTLKLNRIDKTNDLGEKTLIWDKEAIKRVFVSCFTNKRTEQIPLWFMYTKDGFGIRLRIRKGADSCFHDDIVDTSRLIKAVRDDGSSDEYFYDQSAGAFRFENQTIRFFSTDVHYEKDFRPGEGTLLSDFSDAYYQHIIGCVKDSAWDFEGETRIKSIVLSDDGGALAPDYRYLLVPVNFIRFGELDVMYSPWMQESTVGFLNELCDHYLGKKNFIVRPSTFYNKIQR